ncbi:hypothetical protein [Chryseobacterium indoltheticum]|jgi:hypothetical protein|uniref:hypothetical protein n=1 Tax=Chryseobacterium indoltheticum TaxID=254 RepID=UPI0024305A8A|nr:hypothetical protein [Chryseobacterium indoltheticum]MDF2834102.1 hypothetical protein [Chryseobacterium indoltheticum]
MKKNQILKFFVILLFLFNCRGNVDDLQPENVSSMDLVNENGFLNKSSLEEKPIINAVIYTTSSCITGMRYSYYVTSTDVVPYTRQVYSIAKRGDTTIILPPRIIPANSNVSTSVGVFGNEGVKLKDVSIQAQHVFSNGVDVSNDFERPFTDKYIDNCIRYAPSPPSNPCQVDSNDNGTPDCFEFEFENE